MAYCKSCKEECKVIEVDDGIGAYEFWGARGVDIRRRLASDCCEDDVFSDPECTKEITEEDLYTGPDRRDEDE